MSVDRVNTNNNDMLRQQEAIIATRRQEALQSERRARLETNQRNAFEAKDRTTQRAGQNAFEPGHPSERPSSEKPPEPQGGGLVPKRDANDVTGSNVSVRA